MATAIRAAPCASTSSPANGGSASAAVPMTTRAAPPSSDRGHGAFVAQAARDFDADALPRPPRRCRGDRVHCAGTPVRRAVEVDDVEPRAPAVGEPDAAIDAELVLVRGLPVEVALAEAHDAAAAKVDRGQDLEGRLPSPWRHAIVVAR